MIQTLIIEDEKAAAERISRLLTRIDPDILIVGQLDSISSSVEWLRNNSSPDLIILDIQLADGLSFDIFNEVKVESFVIFTTAYDEYAIRAFELNSIAYLLKPIQEEKLVQSISKFRKLKVPGNPIDINAIVSAIRKGKAYKKRFLVNAGIKIKSISVEEIAFFYSSEKSSFLCNTENRHYALEYSLDSLEKMVDPDDFFRINRQYLVKYSALGKIHILSKSRIKIELEPGVKEDVYVAKGKSHEFREWLDK